MEARALEIRNTVKAICRNRRGEILIQKKIYEDGRELYTLPGGGQQPGESLLQALERECWEEIGALVTARDLEYVCEFIKKPTSPGKLPRHKVEFGFRCDLPEDYIPQMGPQPDSHQEAILWLSLEKLANLELSPEKLLACLKNAEAPLPVSAFSSLLEQDLIP
ncbi:NUDIX domain-containing protein [Desulfobulbus rhabdoformis]|uniref:NUDIX domain-containing protein n=1 Tax=Desulfobulbus rhabdoformis TaxID=34032 RepID=UPI0019635150|nr:NUDIX domain-containing protein [Desulfobulbus rhabdoformis]MBM9615090.1 NUDIX domain-containing protein [Desulfobulbus rhabdoformis]